jgi:hypothetical protein
MSDFIDYIDEHGREWTHTGRYKKLAEEAQLLKVGYVLLKARIESLKRQRDEAREELKAR